MAKKWGVKKNFLLAPLAEFAPHFQNRGAAPALAIWSSEAPDENQ